ncbi:MAG: DUF790 family protein [Candidatus Heimdallarchaeaceae archaeon]|jgi:predicted nuclease of restriction endonuclease-like RecB superfamily
MRISLSEFDFEITGTGSKAVFNPIYLQIEENKIVQTFLDFLEENLGKVKSDIPFEILWSLFPSEKIAKSLLVSASRYYSFFSQTTDDIFGETKKETKDSKSEDIASFLSSSGTARTELQDLTPAQIRARIFEIVNRNAKGFVALSERDETLQLLERELAIPRNNIDSLMFLDIESEKILQKNESVETHRLISYFNLDAIETTLCFSISFNILLKKLPGYLGKNLIFISKKNYVFSDISLDEDGYSISIEQPLELFRENGGWGKNIANVAMYIIRAALRDKIGFQLQAIVKPRNRKALYLLKSDNLPLLPTFKADDEDSFKPEIDSKVEEKFLRTWKNFHGWKAIPEPEAIIIGKKMYVPDFLLERSGKSIFLEIVGFYTLKYIQKKKNQMKELAKQDMPIIYLVDEELKTHFADVRDVNILYYSSAQIPNNTLLKLLEENFSDFEERFPIFVKEIELISNEIVDQSSIFSLQDIQRRLKAYSPEETTKILQTPDIEDILKQKSIKFISSFGLVTDEIIKNVEEFLKENQKIPLDTLKEQFPEIKEALISVCQSIGCSVRWKSIDEVEIVFTN